MRKTKRIKRDLMCMYCGHHADSHTTKRCWHVSHREYSGGGGFLLTGGSEDKTKRKYCDCDASEAFTLIVTEKTTEWE